MIVGVRISGEVTVICGRLVIDEGYFTFIQVETTDDFILGLLDFFFSLVVLCLWESSFLKSGKLLFILGVEVDTILLKLDKWIDISCDYKVVIFILILFYQLIDCLLQFSHLYMILFDFGG